jgi:hypothetical protein
MLDCTANAARTYVVWKLGGISWSVVEQIICATRGQIWLSVNGTPQHLGQICLRHGMKPKGSRYLHDSVAADAVFLSLQKNRT